VLFCFGPLPIPSKNGPVVDCSCNEACTCHDTPHDYLRSCCTLALRGQNVDASGPQLQSRPQPPMSNCFRPAAYLPSRFQTPGSTRRSTPPFICLSHSQPGESERRISCKEALAVVRHYASGRKASAVSPNGVHVGATSDGLDKKDCEKDDPIVSREWTYGRVDDRGVGSMRDCCGSIFTKENIYKQIGSFPLEAGKNYVVQVHSRRMLRR